MNYQRQNILNMEGYTPGEQPEDTSVIKLNTNENPYPPHEAIATALRSIDTDLLRRYPSPSAIKFREMAARVHGVEADNIIATNGGDELLRLALTTFVEVGEPVGMAEPSYSLYPVLANIHNSPVVRVALDDHWVMPDNFAAQMNQAKVKLTFIVNPHAPSGKLVSVAEIRHIAEQLDGLLVLDEAYVDFVDPEHHYNAVTLIDDLDNVLILRSLSKGYSLAGLRFGYGIGAKRLIEPLLTKTKDSYNVNMIAQELAVAALTHQDAAAKTWCAVREARLVLCEQLQDLGLTVLPSQSNFLLVTVPDEFFGGAEKVYQALKSAGILVRYFHDPRLLNKLRISIGITEENQRLVECLSQFR